MRKLTITFQTTKTFPYHQKETLPKGTNENKRLTPIKQTRPFARPYSQAPKQYKLN
jgi:hypothetical protein